MTFQPALHLRNDLPARAWYVVRAQSLVVRRRGGAIELPTDQDVASLGLQVDGAYPLGHFEHAQALAVPFDGELPEPFEALGLRSLAALLEPETFNVAGRAIHVVDWASTTRFCGRCGERTEAVAGERCTRCPACAVSYYPRIAPAIIVLVRRGDEALLARNARFPPNLYSTLAGFAEIGESLEETLAREVFEEVGVRVGSIRYFGSQPWPFPHSLMIGFNAEWASGEISVDQREIADAQWFRADHLPQLPPPLSIARRLVDAWVAEVLGR